jgi:hypothetical protein
MREFFLEGGWPMYPITVLGAIAVLSSVRYARAPGRDRLAQVFGFGVATILIGVFGTGLGLQVAARAVYSAPPEQRHLIFAGFAEAMHCVDLALILALAATLIATTAHRRKIPRGAVVPAEA